LLSAIGVRPTRIAPPCSGVSARRLKKPDSMSPDYCEVLRRLAEIRAGTAEMIDGEEFMQEVQRDAGPLWPPGS